MRTQKVETMRVGVLAILLALILCAGSWAQGDDLAAQASKSLSAAVKYLTETIAVGGGYLGSYKIDLQTGKFVDQWGEGHATADQNWIQPPGCPSVGFAFLRAWQETGDPRYLDAAVQVANSLVYGQLECGGWDYIVDHSPAGAVAWYYRHNRNSQDPKLKGGRNQATFDDNVTQHATRLLMAVDLALEQKDAAIHEASLAAIEFILQAQLPTGGWPQRSPRSSRGYSRYVTFNDNSMADCIDVMMRAWEAYGDPRTRESVVKAGQFIIDAQLPGQPTWAQQYDEDLKPGWARKFEPPSACSSESVGVMRTLVRIATFLQDERYLEPLPAAFEWFRVSELTGADKGKWARFYELGTNKPLYFTRDTYLLTYDDSDCPTHYSFKGSYSPASVKSEYDRIMEIGLAAYAKERSPRPLSDQAKRALAKSLEGRVRETIDSQSDLGFWANGDMIDMSVFERNIELLAQYLGLVRNQ